MMYILHIYSVYTYTWYIIYKHTITVLFQVPRRIVPSSPTKTTFSATPWTAQSRSTRHGASHRSPRCPCGALSTWKTHGFPRRMATRILYTAIFLENFGHGNVGTEIAWDGFLRNSELSLFIIRCSMLLETCNLCSIPNSMCQKVAQKKKRGVSRFFVVKVP